MFQLAENNMNEEKNMEDRRSYKRAKLNRYEKKFKVEWRPSEKNDNSEWEEAILVNLSIAGAGIAIGHNLENGTPVSLRFTALDTPSDDIRLTSTVKGEVKNITRINETTWRYGIKFDKLHFAFAQWTEED